MTLLKKSVAACAVALAGLAAVPAGAAVVGSIPGVPLGTNQFVNAAFGNAASIEGYFGANLYLIGGPASIQVEYFGAEASFNNSFSMGSCTINSGGITNINTGGVAIPDPDCASIGPLSGLLSFMFTSQGFGPVSNGANNNNVSPLLPNFFVTLASGTALSDIDTTKDNITAGSGTVAWLFFDDAGAGDDDNHDDMVVRLRITGGSVGIPEPGTVALLGAALLGMGAIRRRRLSK